MNLIKILAYLMTFLGLGFIIFYHVIGGEHLVLGVNSCIWGIITILFALSLFDGNDTIELKEKINIIEEKLKGGNRKCMNKYLNKKKTKAGLKE